MTVVLVGRRQSFIGLSSDSKPVSTAGSSFYETDTGGTYIFDGFGNWTRNPPLYGYATIPIPLGGRFSELPRAFYRLQPMRLLANDIFNLTSTEVPHVGEAGPVTRMNLP